MKKWISVLVPLALLAFPNSSLAEKEKENSQSLTTLEEVVVTATKTEERRKDIPNSVILIDEIDIEESSAKSLGELLANELGIDWRTYGNYGGAPEEIHIRGMSGNATQVFVNGVNINSPSLGVADVSRIPLNTIERIEVVKGSGSLLYGSGAMGGTINIITKTPKKDKIDLKASAGYGTQDTYLASAELGMFVFGDFGYYLTANRRETDGFRDNSDLTQNDVTLKLVVDKGDILNISLYGDYVDRKYGIPGVKPPIGTQDYFIDGIEFYNSESASLLDKGSDDDGHVAFQIKSQPKEWLSFNLRGDYTSLENYMYQRYSFDGTGGKFWTTNKVLGTEGNVDLKPFNGANILLGVQYKDYDWENKSIDLDTSGEEVSGTISTANANLHTTGTYMEAQYRPCKYLKALAGIRHEDNSEFGTEDLPLFGFVFNPLENTVLKLSHGKHFLAPTLNDLYWPESQWTKGNPNLKPETGWHTDATLEQDLFNDKLFITLSYFNWDVKNKIQWAPDSSWVWTPQNLDTYKANGLEAGMRIRPFSNLSFVFDYTYTDAEEENQYVTRQAAYTPKHLFKGGLTYWTNFGLNATATVRYVDDRLDYGSDKTITSPTDTMESYWTADLKLEQRVFDHWLFSLQGNNLFDKEYGTYFGSFMDQTTWVTTTAEYPGSGRSIFFKVTYEY